MVKRIFNHENTIYLLLLPSLAGLALFFLVPFGISMFYASIDNVVSRQFVGLTNLVNTWNNQAFRLAVRNTLTFMGVSIPLNMILALALALVLSPIGPRVRRVLMVFFILPLVIPSGSMVFFWRALIAVNGMFNRMFFVYDGTAMPTDWLNSPHALWFVIGIFIWKNVGFNMI
ncbi:MAG: hypothetical protein FWE90_13185 [Defluviitaleaceae bacterium]|nr:hypothetical protein [Defluviitaleaceae bacterium]